MSDESVLDAILALAHEQRIDLQATLYNEALDHAQRSDFAGADLRLNVLTGLFPQDGDAHLLFARVHVAHRSWAMAHRELQLAEATGVEVPATLGALVERNRQGAVKASPSAAPAVPQDKLLSVVRLAVATALLATLIALLR